MREARTVSQTNLDIAPGKPKLRRAGEDVAGPLSLKFARGDLRVCANQGACYLGIV